MLRGRVKSAQGPSIRVVSDPRAHVNATSLGEAEAPVWGHLRFRDSHSVCTSLLDWFEEATPQNQCGPPQIPVSG